MPSGDLSASDLQEIPTTRQISVIVRSEAALSDPRPTEGVASTVQELREPARKDREASGEEGMMGLSEAQIDLHDATNFHLANNEMFSQINGPGLLTVNHHQADLKTGRAQNLEAIMEGHGADGSIAKIGLREVQVTSTLILGDLSGEATDVMTQHFPLKSQCGMEPMEMQGPLGQQGDLTDVMSRPHTHANGPAEVKTSASCAVMHHKMGLRGLFRKSTRLNQCEDQSHFRTPLQLQSSSTDTLVFLPP